MSMNLVFPEEMSITTLLLACSFHVYDHFSQVSFHHPVLTHHPCIAPVRATLQ